MAFWKRKARKKSAPQAASLTSHIDTRVPRKLFPPEVKLQVIKALEVGLTPQEVSEIVGSGTSTVTAWARAYGEGVWSRCFVNPRTWRAGVSARSWRRGSNRDAGIIRRPAYVTGPGRFLAAARQGRYSKENAGSFLTERPSERR